MRAVILHAILVNEVTSITVYDWPNGFSFVLSFLAPLWTIGKSNKASCE